MIGDSDSGIGSVLSEQEIDSLRFAQDVYGARAKEAASGLADTLGLDEKARQQLVGGVALKLDGLDFEERRGVAQGFQELSVALGGTAVRGRVDDGAPLLDLTIVRRADGTDTPAIAQRPRGISSTGAEQQDLAHAGAIGPNTTDDKESVTAPLNRQQKSWLLRLYDDEDVATIESLSIDQRLEFVGTLTRRYQALKITRLGSDAKRARSEQLTSLIAGQTYKEIAGELGIQEGTLVAGMVKMTESIKKRMNSEQLKRLLPTPEPRASETQELDAAQGGVEATAQAAETDSSGAIEDIDTSSPGAESVLWHRTDTPPETEAETLPGPSLSNEQLEWLNKLFDEESAGLISQLSTEERFNFATVLAERYKTLKVKRLEPAGRQKRAEIIIAFMGDKPYKEVAKDFKLSPSALLDTLDRISGNFSKGMVKSELIGLIPGAKPQETGPASLSKIQKRWLGKIYEDLTSQKAAEELTPAQLDYLADRLGRNLNSAVIRSQGPIKTARRIQELTLLIKGKDYEEIAALTGNNVAAVKSELHHSAIRLKATMSQQQLKNIMRDATLKTEE